MTLSKQRIPILLLIIVLAIVLRVGLAFYLGDTIEEVRGGTYDQISYDALAQRVANGYGFSFAVNSWPYAQAGQPTAFWSYLYTLFLAAVYALVGHHPLWARLLQAVIAGVLMPWFTYRLGSRVFDKRVGLIAAGITAVYFYYILYAGSLMTESFYIVGILWTVDVSLRLVDAITNGRAVGSRINRKRLIWLSVEFGLALGISLLLRQVILFFFVILIMWILWLCKRAARTQQAMAALALAAAVVVMMLAPWIIRNYAVFGRFTMPNTNSGFAFFWSNHPVYGTQFEAVLSPEHGVTYQDLIPEELRSLDEAALDKALLQRGLAFVYADPARYILLSLSRFPIYFQFWPTTDSTWISNFARVFSFGLILPLVIYGLGLTIWRLRPAAMVRQSESFSNELGRKQVDLYRAGISLILLFILIYSGLHLASWANVRYRLPVDAFLVLFAAYGIQDLYFRAAALIKKHPNFIIRRRFQERVHTTAEGSSRHGI